MIMSQMCREVYREIIAPAGIKETMSDWHAAALVVVQEIHTANLKSKKLFKSSAYKFLFALDNSLSVCCGHALFAYRFTRHEIDAAIAEKRGLPTLALTMDQGSAGFAAVCFMHYVLPLQLAPLWDPSHRCIRDIELAFNRAGLSEVVFRMKIGLNSNFGPFEGAPFWRKQQEDVDNFTKGHCHHDPLFQQEWPAIAAASGLGHAERTCR